MSLVEQQHEMERRFTRLQHRMASYTTNPNQENRKKALRLILLSLDRLVDALGNETHQERDGGENDELF